MTASTFALFSVLGFAGFFALSRPFVAFREGSSGSAGNVSEQVACLSFDSLRRSATRSFGLERHRRTIYFAWYVFDA